MSFALLHHGGEGKPKRVFAVGLQAPIYALVGEGLLEGPPAGQATLWWDDLVDPVCRVTLGGWEDPLLDRLHPIGMACWVNDTGYLRYWWEGLNPDRQHPGRVTCLFRIQGTSGGTDEQGTEESRLPSQTPWALRGTGFQLHRLAAGGWWECVIRDGVWRCAMRVMVGSGYG